MMPLFYPFHHEKERVQDVLSLMNLSQLNYYIFTRCFTGFAYSAFNINHKNMIHKNIRIQIFVDVNKKYAITSRLLID